MTKNAPPQMPGQSVDIRYSIVTYSILFVAVVPALAAHALTNHLDGYPLVLCGFVGALATAGVNKLLEAKPELRARFARLAPWQAATGATWVLFLIGPGLGIALGFAANRFLDRSPTVDHPTTALSLKKSFKGPDSVYVASWRPQEEQLLLSLGRGSPLAAVGRETGRPIVVTTRRGALRFEYLVGARLAEPSAELGLGLPCRRLLCPAGGASALRGFGRAGGFSTGEGPGIGAVARVHTAGRSGAAPAAPG